VITVPIQTGVHKKGSLSLPDIVANAKNRKDFSKAGAIATFIGVVRGENDKHEKVQNLLLEAYEEKTDEVLAKICDDLRKKPGIVDVQIHHLLGEFEVGEDLVYVLVAGSHRKDVFPVLEEAVERYKKEAPIFKKESTETKKGETKTSWVTEDKNTYA
jgi:molybdopterin synthase catalytic subunit